MFVHQNYTGMDLEQGDNVDIVVPDPHRWSNIDTASYDVVISGQMLEHCDMCWIVMLEMTRVLKAKGLMCLIVPWTWKIHKFPNDYWRILPAGMQSLADWAQLELLESTTSEKDCIGIFRK